MMQCSHVARGDPRMPAAFRQERFEQETVSGARRVTAAPEERRAASA
jgi:hypothetical protein